MVTRLLKLEADLGGQTVKVQVELDDVWDQISDKDYAEEFAARATSEDVKHAVTLHAPEELWDTGEPEDALFIDLGPWDRQELIRAVQTDDGRRAIDLLRRARVA